MRRLFFSIALLLVGAGLLSAAPANAHPLGNFTINHLSRVSISRDAIDVHYILDQAEIPTFQERGLSETRVLARKRAEIARGLVVTVDGRVLALTPTSSGRLSKPPGQAGLPTTRVELDLRAPVSSPKDVHFADDTFPGRIGWKAVILEPGRATDARSSDAYSTDPTDGLRRYPTNLIQSPLDRRTASFQVRAGDGSVQAPKGPDAGKADNGHSSGDGFAGVFARAADGSGVLFFLLLAAFAWGAIHAVSPGHGKAMVAAYLIGARGTSRHAIALGAIVTFTHTIGVFALGVVTLALSQYILPEDLYLWLNLVSGLMVVIVGFGVMRSRLRSRSHARSHSHDHSHEHGHDHSHSHSHDHAHDHDHSHSHSHDHSHDHEHGHSHLPPDEPSWRGLLGMGAAAGLIPCPSALVVLLGAIAQHQIPLGLLLITVFSLGLATTLSIIGLAVVHSRARLPTSLLGTRLAAALPSISAAVIVAAGALLTFQAIPQLG